ncbi:cobalamin-independent methionine synthase II family protein [Pelagibius litoralis]|uniref:Cobalamin-independent methionine synthase II family protein n=1 Tax=Pelagibius litoralis TaxID=374515 RepID=A0A967F0F7_9PROT|nr:cobalamin-independent methionine synthase II family protein [Pelagibius litoralis]NIA70826.1 cobalamin-independent methionine synthase II family protein [Pelagibius litoralis]
MSKFLTTHVGSLPRPDAVCDVLQAREEAGSPPDNFEAVVAGEVNAIVARQVEIGIDFVSDGEFSKIGYANYVKDRLTGFSGDSPRIPGADLDDFPGFLKMLARWREGALPRPTPCCTGPIAVKDQDQLAADTTRLRAAVDAAGARGGFINAASPGVIALFQANEYYPDRTAYLEALAEAMKAEYRAIVEAGFFLQIDSPDLGMGRHTTFKHDDEATFLKSAREQVEVLNTALDGLPAERLRIHICWGNYEGPHTRDIGLEKILPVLLKARPSTILFEAANPRHAHEWRVFQDIDLPDDKILVPGVIDSTSNYVEHPELVAERLAKFADIVGPERVMAGSDCGFGTFAGDGLVDADVCFAKLAALVEGAKLARERA